MVVFWGEMAGEGKCPVTAQKARDAPVCIWQQQQQQHVDGSLSWRYVTCGDERL